MSAATSEQGSRTRRVFVVSGPSGAGKGTLIRGVMKYFPSLDVAISATTRAPRPGEVNGREYWFLSGEEFDRHLQQDDFLEHVDFAGNRYGTLLSEIDRLHETGKHVILELELNGALAVEAGPMASTLIWIESPDFEELERRLRSRASDTSEEIERRMAVARDQVDAKQHFQYVVVNDDQTRAIAELQAIIERELASPLVG
ncbi:MAG: guanylate kinase [Thermoleophilia bacterium]|nr:guanylate kinase [Thermoleophilia bacterium]